jgi:hypothetical protein
MAYPSKRLTGWGGGRAGTPIVVTLVRAPNWNSRSVPLPKATAPGEIGWY